MSNTIEIDIERLKQLKEFLQALDEILEAWLRGYYRRALEKAEYWSGIFAEKTNLTWQRGILGAFTNYLKKWDIESVSQDLKELADNLGGISDQPGDGYRNYQYFYTHLINAMLTSSEKSNTSALEKAIYFSTRASNVLQKESRKKQVELINERLFFDGNLGYYPQTWCTYWFRGVAEAEIGMKVEAEKDLESAYRLIWQSVEQEHRDHLRKEKEALAGALAGALAEESLQFNSITDMKSLLHRVQELMENYTQFQFSEIERIDAMAEYGSRYGWRILSRFFNDLGLYLFARGDWESAQKALKLSVISDKENPYVRSNYAYFLSFDRREDEAVNEIEQVCETVAKVVPDWLSTTQIVNSQVSGRIYFNIAMLAYKWTYRTHTIVDRARNPEIRKQEIAKRIDRFKKAIDESRDNNGGAANFFNDNPERACNLFTRAAGAYLSVKDLQRYLPSLFMTSDPLAVSEELKTEQHALMARRLLWDFCYGMGPELATSFVRHFNKIYHYLAGWDPRRSEITT